LAFVAVGACALTVAACGSDSSNDNGSKSASSGTGSGAAKLSGDPIKIMAMAPVNSQVASFPAISDAATVYEKYINAHGGIGGRPLEVIKCDNRLDVNAAAKCARDGVSDGVVAGTGYTGIGMDKVLAIFGAKSIPWMPGASSGNPYEFNDGNSFPINVGSFQAVGRALIAVKYGCRNSAVLAPQLPQTELNQQLNQKTLKEQGFPESKIVRYPPTTPDIAPFVAKLKGADCIIDGGMAEQVMAKFGAAMQQAGITPKRLIMSPTLTVKTIKESAAVWNGKTTMVSYWTYPTADNAWKTYLSAVKDYASLDTAKNDYTASGSAGVWVAMNILGNTLKKVVEAGGTVDGAALKAELSKTTGVETGGLAPTIDFTKTTDIKDFPRLFSPNIGVAEVQDGKIVPDSEYHNIGEAIAGRKMTDPYFAPAS
jgi:ABC-type branched-subunit amino acid transport system substrate-binding protein